MASSMVAGNWDHVDGHDCSENFELSSKNHNLLMSLLDESQIDDCGADDERLTKVIQSLQDELDFANHSASWEGDGLVDCLSSVDESYGQGLGCPSMMAPEDLDIHWMDVEFVPTSPDVANWFVDHHPGQGVSEGGVSDQFGWIKNTFSVIEDDQDCGSFLHVTNASFD